MVTKDGVYVLDMAAKIDATADYICKAKWGDVEFPPPFGREAYPEVKGRGAEPGRRGWQWVRFQSISMEYLAVYAVNKSHYYWSC